MLSPFLKKLMFARQFFNINGKLEILGERNVILEPDLLLMLGKDGYEFGKKAAKSFFTKYAKKIDLIQNNYANLMNLLEILGLGSIKIMKATQNSATVVVKDSVEAERYIKSNGRSKSPVCDFTAGFLAGTFSFISKKNTDARETACNAKGDASCVFEIKW